MKYLLAINSEKTSKDYGQIISSNKFGTNKGLDLEDFKEAVKNQQEWHENEQQILEELRSFLVTAIPTTDLSLRYK